MIKMDPETVQGLLALGGAVLVVGGPVAWIKALDLFQWWRLRKVPPSRRLATIDWLDPELRRN